MTAKLRITPAALKRLAVTLRFRMSADGMIKARLGWLLLDIEEWAAAENARKP